MSSFFSDSAFLDHMALRPLSHIRGNWELTWDAMTQSYRVEDDSYAEKLNALIRELDQATPPPRYHDNEDRLAEYVRDHLNWPVRKVDGRWIGADYGSLLEQGGFHDIDEANLVLAAAGRIHAARLRNQMLFDDMEESHRRMLATVVAVILYHRS